MIDNLDNVALSLADKALEHQFDAEAYIVKYIAEKRLTKDPDNIIPETNIDECIQIMLKLFVLYYNDRTVDNLNNLLSVLEQVITELYNTCTTNAERTAIIQSIDKMHGL